MTAIPYTAGVNEGTNGKYIVIGADPDVDVDFLPSVALPAGTRRVYLGPMLCVDNLNGEPETAAQPAAANLTVSFPPDASAIASWSDGRVVDFRDDEDLPPALEHMTRMQVASLVARLRALADIIEEGP